MTTAQDLMIVAVDLVPGRSVEPGDLSLALAGAELLDLVAARAVTLDGDRVIPNPRQAFDDRLLDEASSALTRQSPYESVEDWLWRRGRGLSAGYLKAWEAEGPEDRKRHRWIPSRTQQPPVPADSPARLRAEERWVSDEPVLVALATAAGVRERTDEDPLVATAGPDATEGPDADATEDPDVTRDPDATGDPDAADGLGDDSTVTVLAAVNEAVMELEAVRQRRAIENAAFDNIWRGL
ncbi:GPP34 family phosphoprotein [Streptomyces sp. NPDC127072]|uniref:GOLPH3/VPS74 family protein n=1 Tax=Streptomyces sp. NPDC127072 TaxID=3347129 RepID=UPI003650C51C